MPVGETRGRLLRELAVASGAQEASWEPVSGPCVRVRTRGPHQARPSWNARGPRGAWGLRDAEGAGLLDWPSARCERDPLLAAGGIAHLRGWRTVRGATLLLGGAAPLSVSDRELELQAVALEALAGAEGAGPSLEQLGLEAASVAHDMRNLLSVAQLELEVGGLGEDAAAEHRLRDTLREARGLAEGFLGGAGPSRRHLTDLSPLLRRSAVRAREIAHVPGPHAVDVQLHGERDGFVIGRNDQLARIFDNLLANAVSAAARGAEPVPVECELFRTGDLVVVEVRDRRPGHSERDLLDVLAPGRTASGGAGFGTASVRQCLDLLGARLAIESEPGSGTTCRVTLRGSHPPGTRVGLVVAADPKLRAAWVAALRSHGVEGLGADTPAEALAWSEVLQVRGVLWARGTPGVGRRELEAGVRARGRPWCELAVGGPGPRTPTDAAAGRVLAAIARP